MGVSNCSYSHTRENGVFGTGQGSVMSMYSCLMQMSRIIDAHMKRSHGAKYLDPTGSHRDLIICVLGYVDDNNISNTGEKIQIYSKYTQENSRWCTILERSGHLQWRPIGVNKVFHPDYTI